MFSFLIGLALCANAANAEIYTNPSELNGVKIPYVKSKLPDITIPQNNMVKIANDEIQKIKEIRDILHKYNRTIIKKMVCSNETNIDGNVFRLLNVAPGHEQDIIDVYLDGVCETLGKENMTAYDDCMKQIGKMSYISDGYWNYDYIYFDNINKTAHNRVWKSLNDDDSSNWIISVIGKTHIAQDILIIDDNHCSSSKCSSHQYIKQIPDNLTNTDIQILDTFYNSFLIRSEVEALGIKDKINMTQLMWPREYC